MNLAHLKNCIATVFVLLLCQQTALAQVASEADVKSAYLYNFLKLAEWQSRGSSEQVVLCISGDEQEIASLSALNNKEVKSSTVSVKLLSALANFSACHVIFVSEQYVNKQLRNNLKALSLSGILTIGEDPDFLVDGGIIKFYNEDNRVKFEINSSLATESKINLGSKLLSLAKIYLGN